MVSWWQTADGFGDYVYATYKETEVTVKDIAAAIASQGVKRGDKVGVFGANCPEWMITMQVPPP